MGRNVKVKVGDVQISENYGEVVVICVYGSESVDVEFLATGYRTNVRLKYYYKGRIVDRSCKLKPGKKPVHGLVEHHSYKEWMGVIYRTKPETQLKYLKNRTYMGTGVCDEWKDPARYHDWYMSQEFAGAFDYLGKRYNIEKDILVPGNMTYSPETCVHVPTVINSFFTFIQQPRDRLTGVYLTNGKKRPYGVNFNPWPHVNVHQQSFVYEEEAHAYYCQCKENQAKFLAECFDGFVDKRVIGALESFTVNKYATPKMLWDTLTVEEKLTAAMLAQ